MQHPRCSTSAVELFFIKIVGIDSTLTTLLKIFPSKNFSCNYIKIFSALLLKYLTGAPFLIKLLAVHYSATGHNFTKTLTDRRIFSQIILFKAANFWSIFRRESLLKPANSKVAVLTLQPYYFSGIFICAEELNYIKYYMKYKRRL